MVCVDWAAVYAERHHDDTIKRITSRIGRRPDSSLCPRKVAEVDALVVKLSAGRGKPDRTSACCPEQHGIAIRPDASGTVAVEQSPEQRVSELVGESAALRAPVLIV